MSTIGHNSITQAAREKLHQIVRAVENLQEAKANLAADISAKYAEAKSLGFDTKVLRAVVKRRAQDKQAVEEFEQLLDLYLHALGDLA